MGMAKRQHIATIAAMPDVAAAWKDKYGSVCGEADIDAMYADFLPLQKQTLGDHCQVIAGIPELAQWLRAEGLKIGSSTGYTRELMAVVSAAAAQQGYQPDCTLCAEDAPQGRPAPFLLFEAAKRLNVYPLWHMVKVDDTPVGIQAGRNAGCWTIGISRTGNCVGLSQTEFQSLAANERASRLRAADEKLLHAGAHAVVESAADIHDALRDFETRLSQGKLPMH